jgi:hypothetical protein
MPALSVRDLPASARPIAEVIGVDATIRLGESLSDPANRRRGRFYVPTVEHLTPEHKLARWVGLTAARQLSRTFGGEDIPVPNCRNAVRTALVWFDFMAGLSCAQVAARHALSERRVRQITAEERGPLPDNFHQLISRGPRSPERAAIDRLNGTLGGRTRTTMIKELLARLQSKPESPYGAAYAMIRAFSPKLEILIDEKVAHEVDVDRAVQLISARLPAEIRIGHGDHASLMQVKPDRLSPNRADLFVRVSTPLSAATRTQNALIIHALDALAHAMRIEQQGSASARPAA